jgi:hypothetical protein
VKVRRGLLACLLASLLGLAGAREAPASLGLTVTAQPGRTTSATSPTECSGVVRVLATGGSGGAARAECDGDPTALVVSCTILFGNRSCTGYGERRGFSGHSFTCLADARHSSEPVTASCWLQ